MIILLALLHYIWLVPCLWLSVMVYSTWGHLPVQAEPPRRTSQALDAPQHSTPSLLLLSGLNKYLDSSCRLVTYLLASLTFGITEASCTGCWACQSLTDPLLRSGPQAGKKSSLNCWGTLVLPSPAGKKLFSPAYMSLVDSFIKI